MKIDCESLANEILDKVRAVPNKKKLVIITVGNDPASASYVKGKKKDCDRCGIEYIHEVFDEDATPTDVANMIAKYNDMDSVGGIILQLPTPFDKAIEDGLTYCISSEKDVDGFRFGSPFKPCTPEGIIHILKKEYGNLEGANVLLIGRGKLVGKPLIDLLMDENCTLTIAHSKSKNILQLLFGNYDIIITAINSVHSIDMFYCHSKIVVDAGIGYHDGHLCGNCYNYSYDSIYKITPVPKGVGLLTRAMLMAHIAKASDPDFEY